jgi:hypothetical protein
MQTVMTALIERIRTEYNFHKNSSRDNISMMKIVIYELILDDADEMIKQERDQIEEAYTKGWMDITDDWSNETTGEDYYNKTYIENKGV